MRGPQNLGTQKGKIGPKIRPYKALIRPYMGSYKPYGGLIGPYWALKEVEGRERERVSEGEQRDESRDRTDSTMTRRWLGMHAGCRGDMASLSRSTPQGGGACMARAHARCRYNLQEQERAFALGAELCDDEGDDHNSCAARASRGRLNDGSMLVR